MIVTTNIPGGHRGHAPRRPRGHELWASIDVEWTKNYRITNGNRPFCVSVVYLAIPGSRRTIDPARCPFSYTSLYLDAAEDTPALLAGANAIVRAAVRQADRVTGHQFTSDLAVLRNHSPQALPDLDAARRDWLQRRSTPLGERHLIDTRYDTDAVLSCRSRRLVDVCTDLRLDVTQPELRGTSMTALHHRFLREHSQQARERISVLNLRHSLSTALVALRSTGRADWSGELNVNHYLATQLDGAFDWLQHPTFTNLL